MARGKKCRDCGTNMFADREDSQPQGAWVYYRCLSGTCNGSEKVFEGK
jgi:hypothetical protein